MGIRVIGEVLKIFDLEVDTSSESGYDNLRFRIELIANQEKPSVITVRVWRKEYYRIQPTFPQEGSQPKHDYSDELLLVEETSIVDPETVNAKNWENALALVLKKLEERFKVL